MTFRDSVQRALDQLEQQGLRRRARTVSGPQGPRVIVDGRRALCLCSNNYLGFAGDVELAAALAAGLVSEGCGAGASRHVSGNMGSHLEAEACLAGFAGFPAAVLFSTGYACNLGVIQALATRDDVIFSDSLNHASLIDGARLSRASVVVFAHGDPLDLEEKLRRHRSSGSTALVVTESLFSMDGDEAPLPELARLACEYDAALVVDEAHALGVYGHRGRGLCAARGVVPDVLLGALGKAFGIQGAFAAADGPVVDLIRNRARSYVFSTAPGPATARAVLASAALVAGADDRRSRLNRHARRLRHGLSELGFQLIPGDSPIIPVVVGAPEPTMALSRALLERGVFVHGIRPPTVPPGSGRLRVVPMATHGDADIDEALSAFAALAVSS